MDFLKLCSKYIIKICTLMLILIMTLTNLSGCYYTHGIEDLAYATAIGLDVSENHTLSLTIQFSMSSTDGQSGSSQSSNTNAITVDCNSINSGISLINSYIGKQVNLSHCKVIVISEELAAQGVSEYLDTLVNHIEVRPNCNVIISRCTAKSFIKSAQPFIETLTARYYEIALTSSEYTGYTTATELVELVDSIQNSYSQGYAILGGISGSNQGNVNNTEIYDEFTNNYVAGETPILDSGKVETFGTAVFYADKLVGELNGIETICHLLVTNKLESCIISIPNPFTINSNLDLQITRQKSTDITVDFINGSPHISVAVYLEGYGLSLDEDINYEDSTSSQIINYYAEEYMKLQLENYLYKTSKELN